MESTVANSRLERNWQGLAIAGLAGLLAVIVRWYFVTHAQVLQPLYESGGWGDAAEYYRYAWNLAHHGMFSADPAGSAHPTPDSFRDPGYPAFLALLMASTATYDQWYATVLLGQALLGGLTVTFAVLAMREALPTWLLIAAALLMALWPHLITITAYVLSENLSAPLCALAALLLGEAARRGSTNYVILGGITLAAASLTNAVVAPLVIPLALIFAWKRTMPRRRLALLAIVAIAPFIGWGFRNATIPATTSASYRAEINLVQGSWPTYHAATRLWARHDPVGIQTVEAIDAEIAVVHADRSRGLRLMADRMSTSPATYAMWYLSKPALLWGWTIELGAGDIYVYPTRNSPFVTHPLWKLVEATAFVTNNILAILALAGTTIVALRRTPPAALIVFAVMTAWITLIYGVLQSDARYAIPFRAAEIALACLTVHSVAIYLRRRSASAPLPPAA